MKKPKLPKELRGSWPPRRAGKFNNFSNVADYSRSGFRLDASIDADRSVPAVSGSDWLSARGNSFEYARAAKHSNRPEQDSAPADFGMSRIRGESRDAVFGESRGIPRHSGAAGYRILLGPIRI